MDQEQRDELDRGLSLVGAPTNPWTTQEAPKTSSGPKPPSWWRGDRAAAASTLAAARSMGFTVMEQV